MKVIVTPEQADVLLTIEAAAKRKGSRQATAIAAVQAAARPGELDRILDTLQTFGFIARGNGPYRDILLRSASTSVPPDAPFVAELGQRGYLVRRTFLP